ncbi:MAG TPA: hypothetical protein VMB79_07730 [Jatrophihabitans sp.]|nr:hypothetical protein [Jatrophihabitans sp.]
MAASIVRFRRVDPAANPAALVAAWLIDALAADSGVRLQSSDAECIMLDVSPAPRQASVRELVGTALAEPRFAGWQVVFE